MCRGLDIFHKLLSPVLIAILSVKNALPGICYTYKSNNWTYFRTGIIYCFSQKDSEQVTASLQKLGIRAGAYHANMEPEDKTTVHRRWSANEIQVRYMSPIET